LIFKTKLILSFIVKAMTTKNSWSIGNQCFICKHEAYFKTTSIL